MKDRKERGGGAKGGDEGWLQSGDVFCLVCELAMGWYSSLSNPDVISSLLNLPSR